MSEMCVPAEKMSRHHRRADAGFVAFSHKEKMNKVSSMPNSVRSTVELYPGRLEIQTAICTCSRPGAARRRHGCHIYPVSGNERIFSDDLRRSRNPVRGADVAIRMWPSSVSRREIRSTSLTVPIKNEIPRPRRLDLAPDVETLLPSRRSNHGTTRMRPGGADRTAISSDRNRLA